MMVPHEGGCHCGAVRFSFQGPEDLIAWECNCSICSMKRNTHVIVPRDQFTLLAGEDNLQLYQFGTKTARHTFCKTCGICPFYNPRSNPTHYAVTAACITPGTVKNIEVRFIDGQNWEEAVAASGITALTPG